MTKAEPVATAKLLTPRGRGAVATIEVHGSGDDWVRLDHLFAAANNVNLSQQPVGRIAFGTWGTFDPREELVIVRADRTHLEIHCHGGDACVDRILDDLQHAGFHPPTEAVDNRREVLDGAIQNAITEAVTLRTAAILLKQQRLWRELMERNEPPGSEELEAIRQWTSFGLHLTEPWQIVIIGEPNVGKSTLLNALLGFERSIVFDQPGTTRDVVSARTVFAGWPIVLSDTAGLRESSDKIEAAGVRSAELRRATADLCLVVVDLTDSRRSGELSTSGASIRVGNKADRIAADDVPADIDIAVSAQTGKNIAVLIEQIVRKLVPAEPPAGQCVPVSSRHMRLLERFDAVE